MAGIKPLYRKTLQAARLMGDLAQWRESRKENSECAHAISV